MKQSVENFAPCVILDSWGVLFSFGCFMGVFRLLLQQKSSLTLMKTFTTFQKTQLWPFTMKPSATLALKSLKLKMMVMKLTGMILNQHHKQPQQFPKFCSLTCLLTGISTHNLDQTCHVSGGNVAVFPLYSHGVKRFVDYVTTL